MTRLIKRIENVKFEGKNGIYTKHQRRNGANEIRSKHNQKHNRHFNAFSIKQIHSK